MSETALEETLEEALREIQKLVDMQAEDEGLWFEAETASEDYLQRHLRELHRQIEKFKKEREVV